jgi:hypothetical protein
MNAVKLTKQVVDQEVDALRLAILFAEAGFERLKSPAYEIDYEDSTASRGSPGARRIGPRQSSKNPSWENSSD